MTITDIINLTIAKEGGWVNNPNDPGGETNFGITKRVAQGWGYKGAMKDMPRATAILIYMDLYASPSGAAAVAPISDIIAAELFDAGVNMGNSWAPFWLQQWLNVFNRQGQLYSDIVADGKIGNGGPTVKALQSYLNQRGAGADQVMLKALKADRNSRYKSLALAKQTNEDFIYGWIKERG